MLKRSIKKIINKLGFDLRRYDKNQSKLNFDDLLEDKISSNPIIFDVGANKGQSVEKYLKIFDKPIIHSFEPVTASYNHMHNKFKNKTNIFLNNVAVGYKIEEKEINVAAKTATSSFNKFNLSTNWLKEKSKQYNTSLEGYVTSVQKANVITLDAYAKNNNINLIDLVKIDTQGYEDKVLEGSLNLIKENKIKVIISEIIFDDIYEKYLSFSDLEKFLVPFNFRMVAINLHNNNNLFSGLPFYADVCYFNKQFYSF